MKPRILILPFSALVIAGLAVWRLQREPSKVERPTATVESKRLAPQFELYDQRSQLVKFARYLGRTSLLIYFFDGGLKPEEDRQLTALRDDYASLKSAGIDVVAVSSATPFAIREAENRAGQEFPFPVLTDVDRHSPVPVPVHRLWGLADAESSDARSGLFFIERDGRVAYSAGLPVAVEDPAEFVAGLLSNSR